MVWHAHAGSRVPDALPAQARALSGEYVGFNSAWGYWVSAWIGNVGYLVAAFGALGYFYPAFRDEPVAVDNRRLQEVFLNMIYAPLKGVELGAEYIYGQRMTFAGDSGTLSRFNLMARYSFEQCGDQSPTDDRRQTRAGAPWCAGRQTEAGSEAMLPC